MMRAILVVAAVLCAAAGSAGADSKISLAIERDNLLPLVDPQPSVVVQSRVNMPAAATGHRPDRLWQAIDAAALIMSTATLVIDWRQTRSAAQDGWSADRQEVGYAQRMIGARPSVGRVDGYFLGAAVANAALWAIMPRRWRSVVPGLVIGAEVYTVTVNLPTTRL